MAQSREKASFSEDLPRRFRELHIESYISIRYYTALNDTISNRSLTQAVEETTLLTSQVNLKKLTREFESLRLLYATQLVFTSQEGISVEKCPLYFYNVRMARSSRV